MNLPTEYVKRHGRVNSMLTLPCCLLLETQGKKKNDRLSGKIALRLYYSNEAGIPGLHPNDFVKVHHYDLPQSKQNTLPEPTQMSVVPAKDIFTDTRIIIPNTKIVPFCETPYLFRGKQNQSMPNSILQEKEYVGTIDNFFSPEATKNRREEWLWAAFEKLNVSADIRLKYGGSSSRAVDQEIVKMYAKPQWNLWTGWHGMFLNYVGVAPELIFGPYFNSHVVSPEIEDDVIHPPAEVDPFAIAAGMLPRYGNRPRPTMGISGGISSGAMQRAMRNRNRRQNEE